MAQTQSIINRPESSVLTDNLPLLFATYPKFTKLAPSSWFVWSNETGKVHKHFLEACHASMQWDVGSWTDLITAISPSDDISLAYQRMLINGPFRSMADKVTIKREGEHYYAHCTDLDKWPANVLFNYCIATRAPFERKSYVEYWASLCKEGYDPVLAFLLSYSTAGEPGPRTFPWIGHLWVDPSSDWSRIIKGDITNCSLDYKSHPKDCRPSNTIWGTSSATRTFEGMTNEEVSAFLGLPIKVDEPVKPPEEPKAYKKYKPLGLAAMYEAGQAVPEAAVPVGNPFQFHWNHAGPAINQVMPAGAPPVFNGDAEDFDEDHDDFDDDDDFPDEPDDEEEIDDQDF